MHPGAHPTGMLKVLQVKGQANGSGPDPASNVSDAIVVQILSGHGKQIFLPAGHRKVKLVRAFPFWMQELLKDLGLGVN